MPVSTNPLVSEYAVSFAKIESLQEEARRLLLKIQELYSQIGNLAAARGSTGGKAYQAGRKPGRGPRGKRGALKEAIRKILADGMSVRPADIQRRLPSVGYHSASDPRVLYTSVYLALKRDNQIQKTSEGFRLKTRAAKKTGKK
jgi:hypothetical protein